MSAIGKPKFHTYGSINPDVTTAVTVIDLPSPLEIADTEAKICCLSPKVFFNIGAAASMSVAVLSGGAVALANNLPGVGVVLIIGSAAVPYLYKRVAEDCPKFCCRPT